MKYSIELERTMQFFYNGLSEKDQRHYAAQEVLKLSWGGKSYISALFQISHRRIRQGILELQNPSILGEIPPKRQRRLGSGRKKKK